MEIDNIILHLKSVINKLDTNLANNIIYFVCGDISFYYIHNNEVIKYILNHKYMDGELFAYYIKNDILKPQYINDFKIQNLSIPQWQILEYYQSNILYYTKFIKTIALTTHDIISNKKNDINIGVIVSTREDNVEKGNFVQLVSIPILKTDNHEQICLKLYDSIKNSKKQKNKPSSVIDTIINTNLNFDYIFNSHRNLSNFIIDNKSYKKVHSNYSLDYIQNVFYNTQNKCKYFIILDYDLNTDKYFISSIFNINIELIRNINLNQ